MKLRDWTPKRISERKGLHPKFSRTDDLDALTIAVEALRAIGKSSKSSIDLNDPAHRELIERIEFARRILDREVGS